MTIPLAVNFGVTQRESQQTLPAILGIEASNSADVGFAQLCPQLRGGLPPRVLRRVREYVEAHLENRSSPILRACRCRIVQKRSSGRKV